jgi:RIO-like serine/threonine protein kinase
MNQSQLLKKDVFGEIWRISGDNGDTIVRDTGTSRVWAGWLARVLMRREARILAQLDGLPGVPTLLSVSNKRLTRRFIAGLPLQEARPDDPKYFSRAARLVRRMHRAGVAHNDLAKEPNVLRTDDGQPAFVDFQLASTTHRRGRIFRVLAYDDIRHLLKHKRSYCPHALTARERRILANPSVPARIWMRTGKPVYLFVTRSILGWSDREGATDRDHRG